MQEFTNVVWFYKSCNNKKIVFVYENCVCVCVCEAVISKCWWWDRKIWSDDDSCGNVQWDSQYEAVHVPNFSWTCQSPVQVPNQIETVDRNRRLEKLNIRDSKKSTAVKFISVSKWEREWRDLMIEN
jgi:hypothetical protein